MNKDQILPLKRRLHKLKPVVIIGNQGLGDSVHAAIDEALNAHELIKIRVNAEDRAAREQMITAICEKHRAELIDKIGHIVAIYREKSE
ncbi:MAG: YhbY family RNA-binding protein [Gammaproteobacteria bacterium]|nr:YhbY family RNA-binding protein [Gammaproteobacteria bacterium]